MLCHYHAMPVERFADYVVLRESRWRSRPTQRIEKVPDHVGIWKLYTDLASWAWAVRSRDRCKCRRAENHFSLLRDPRRRESGQGPQ